MKVSSVTDTKNGLSAILAAVKQGESFLITEHHHAVAEISPVDPGHLTDGNWLARLSAEGLVHPPRKKLNVKAFLDLRKALGPGQGSVSQALLEERGTGR